MIPHMKELNLSIFSFKFLQEVKQLNCTNKKMHNVLNKIILSLDMNYFDALF